MHQSSLPGGVKIFRNDYTNLTELENQRERLRLAELAAKEAQKATDDLRELSKNKDDLQHEYDQLKSAKSALQTNYDELVTNKSVLQREKDQLQSSYNELSGSNQSLKQQYDQVISDRSSLQSKYDSLSTERSNLEESRRILSSQIETERSQQQQRERLRLEGANNLDSGFYGVKIMMWNIAYGNLALDFPTNYNSDFCHTWGGNRDNSNQHFYLEKVNANDPCSAAYLRHWDTKKYLECNTTGDSIRIRENPRDADSAQWYFSVNESGQVTITQKWTHRMISVAEGGADGSSVNGIASRGFSSRAAWGFHRL